MNNRIHRLLGAVGCVAIFAACSAPLSPAAIAAKPNLARAYNRFGFALFGRLVEAEPDTNVAISPTSVAIGLALTANGAKGATRAGIVRALQLPQLVELSGLDAANQELLADLRSPVGDVKLSIASALWVTSRATIEPPFAEVARDSFSATTGNVSFGSPTAAATITAYFARILLPPSNLSSKHAIHRLAEVNVNVGN